MITGRIGVSCSFDPMDSRKKPQTILVEGEKADDQEISVREEHLSPNRRASDTELEASLFEPFCPKVVSEWLSDPSHSSEPKQNEFYAAMFFLDITGFTNLSEAMCQSGSEGVSLLATVINDYFGTLNRTIIAYGGDVLKFCGDAVMAMWTKAPKDALVMRAICCAVKLQQELGEYHVKTVNRTLRIKITISAGKIASLFVGGQRNRFEYLVSGPPLKQLGPLGDIVKGGEILLTIEAWENVRGQVGVTPIIDKKARKAFESSMFNLHKKQFNPELSVKSGWCMGPCIPRKKHQNGNKSEAKREEMNYIAPQKSSSEQSILELRRRESARNISAFSDGADKYAHLAQKKVLPNHTACLKVIYLNPAHTYDMETIENVAFFPKSWSQSRIKAYSHKLEMFVPRPVALRLHDYHPVLRKGVDDESFSFIEKRLAEMRRISVMFINLHGLLAISQKMGLPYVDLNYTQTTVATIQGAVYRRQGAIRQVVEDDKGLVAIAIFGVSSEGHGDVPARAALSAMDCYTELRDIGVHSSIGVTTGKAYCGIVGNLKNRCEFCVMGDIVNLSARLMSKSMKTGQPVYMCNQTKLGAAAFVDFTSKGEIKVKGKNIPVEVFVPSALDSTNIVVDGASKTNNSNAEEEQSKNPESSSINSRAKELITSSHKQDKGTDGTNFRQRKVRRRSTVMINLSTIEARQMTIRSFANPASFAGKKCNAKVARACILAEKFGLKFLLAKAHFERSVLEHLAAQDKYWKDLVKKSKAREFVESAPVNRDLIDASVKEFGALGHIAWERSTKRVVNRLVGVFKSGGNGRRPEMAEEWLHF